MSGTATEERKKFEELRKALADAIKESYKTSSDTFEENIRKQRSNAIAQMNDAIKNGDLWSAQFYELAIQQYSHMLRDPY